MENLEHLDNLIYFGEKESERISLSQAAPFCANSDSDMPASPVPMTQAHDWLLQNIAFALEHISEQNSSKANGPPGTSDQDVPTADACPSLFKASTGARGPSFIEGISKSSYIQKASDLKGSVKVVNCHDSVIYILEPLRYATIYGCSDATIVVGAVGKIPNWFEDEFPGCTQDNPFPLPDDYLSSQHRNHYKLGEIKQILRETQLEESQKRKLSSALHIFLRIGYMHQEISSNFIAFEGNEICHNVVAEVKERR